MQDLPQPPSRRTRHTLHFRLGQEERTLRDVDPSMTVLTYLREHERLCGTKEGCAEGDCGACTVVLVDNKNGRTRHQAVNACILFMPALDGRQLLTVEHLAAADGRLHPVQQAMVDYHASQCGFCTPGFVMSLFALRADGRSGPPDGDGSVLDRHAVNEALAGNLCRCTGYRPIVDAALAVCRLASPAADGVGSSGPGSGEVAQAEFAAFDAELSGSDTPLSMAYSDRRCLAPRSTDELAEILVRHPDAVLVAGGTDVGLWVTKQHRTWKLTVALDAVTDLTTISETTGAIRIGAAATYTDALPVLERHWPDFGALIRRLGCRQIRNRGTIGGNIANASPIGDTPPALLALDASLTLRHGLVRRTVRLEDFFTGYRRTALAPGEFIEAIEIPLPKEGEIFRCYKASKRFDQDISAVCGAFRLTLKDAIVQDIRIGFGGMAATPARAQAVEQALLGRRWTEAAIRGARDALDGEFSPLTDMRASAFYRRTVARNLLLKFFLETTQPEAALRLVPA